MCTNSIVSSNGYLQLKSTYNGHRQIFANCALRIRNNAITFSFFNPYQTLSTKKVRYCLLRTNWWKLSSQQVGKLSSRQG